MSKIARSPRRRDPLTRDRIIEAAVEILDRDGASALTFKALTAQLQTGAGAIYHHIDDKAELLSAATDQIVVQLLAGLGEPAPPAEALRALSLGIFDAIDAHPWLGAQLPHNPLPAVFRIWAAVGDHLQKLGVPPARLSDAGSTLVNYVLGSASQYAAGARTAGASESDRQAYLDTLTQRISDLNAGALDNTVAEQLHEHDDRGQFLAGIDIILTGITHLTTDP